MFALNLAKWHGVDLEEYCVGAIAGKRTLLDVRKGSVRKRKTN